MQLYDSGQGRRLGLVAASLLLLGAGGAVAQPGAPAREPSSLLATHADVQELRYAPDRIKGYTGTQLVTVRTTPELLPCSLDNGATSLSQSGAAKREEEIEAARTELIARAATTAVGQRVTGVEWLEIDPQRVIAIDSAPASPMLERAAVPRPVPTVAIGAGDSTVGVTVLLTVRLAPAE